MPKKSIRHIKTKTTKNKKKTKLSNTHKDVSLQKNNVLVNFEILNQQTKKVSCDGYFNYSLIDLKTGKALIIPEWIIERFSL